MCHSLSLSFSFPVFAICVHKTRTHTSFGFWESNFIDFSFHVSIFLLTFVFRLLIDSIDGLTCSFQQNSAFLLSFSFSFNNINYTFFHSFDEIRKYFFHYGWTWALSVYSVHKLKPHILGILYNNWQIEGVRDCKREKWAHVGKNLPKVLWEPH